MPHSATQMQTESGIIELVNACHAPGCRNRVTTYSFPSVAFLRAETARGSPGDLGSHLADLARGIASTTGAVIRLIETFIRAETRSHGLRRTAGWMLGWSIPSPNSFDRQRQAPGGASSI